MGCGYDGWFARGTTLFLENVMRVSVLEFGWAGKKGGEETEDSAFDSTLPVGEVRSARYC